MKKGLYKKCERCNKEFYEYSYLRNRRKYCSTNCSNKANAKHLSKIRVGKNNPMYGKIPWNYKDGKSHSRHYDMRYWIWRRKVFQRDKQICQECGKKLQRKHCIAHHIKPWNQYKRFRFVVSNGVTLCRPCHNRIDPFIKMNHF